jgi:multidrug efflux pump subunit AcrB
VIAVFAPISMMGGIMGRLFREFAMVPASPAKPADCTFD